MQYKKIKMMNPGLPIKQANTLKKVLYNWYLIVVLSSTALTATAQVSPDAASSPKTKYLLPDGKVFLPEKLDSLESVWGKDRIAFQHSAEDDENGVIHLVRVTDEMMKNFEAQKNKDKLAFASMLYTPAPDFELEDLKGTNWSLKDLKGKIVVLNFWFTSCAPCIQEMPELNKLVKAFESKDVVFLGLTFNNKQQVEAFTKRHSFSYHLLPNSGEIDKKYQIASWPTSIVIDQNGSIRMITQASPRIKDELEAAIKVLQ